eukprot:Lithocolla_globosa_v1_NODE_680_length_3450_cov_44.467452.p1 type:complete len:712 gc:universal NODE_680_length_3450_cov_44.467452:821-2956(+)
MIPVRRELTENNGVSARIDSTLSIFNTQYNVGRECVQRFMAKNALDPTRITPATNINLLMVGPAFVDLREQTKTDLLLWQESVRAEGLHFRGNLGSCVWNSSSLLSDEATELFMDCLQKEPANLNILIHDEAHWGIGHQSQLNRFFQQVGNRNAACHPHLLVLGVSATPYSLTTSQTVFHGPQDRVNWTQLRYSEPGVFGAPTYRSIYDLDYRIDGNLPTNEQEATQYVKDEYLAACTRLQHNQLGNTVADTVLRSLQSTGASSAILRMRSSQAANEVTQAVRNIGILAVLLEQGQPMGCWQQLRAQTNDVRYYGLKLDQCDFSSFLIVVIQKLAMGERAPKTVLFMDTRNRYRETINSQSTYEQDVGRLAGHGKPRATVFYGNVDPIPRSLDRYLTPTGRYINTTKAKHPEVVPNGVYTQLKPHFVVLEAEPQIGKTGAVLAMLSILHDLVRARKRRSDDMDATVDQDYDTLVAQTKRWSALANESLDLFRTTFNGDAWRQYHELLERRRDHFEGWPIQTFNERLCMAVAEDFAGVEEIRVADCGCGTKGAFSALQSSIPALEDENMSCRVYGFDLDNSIQGLAVSGTTLDFYPCVGDMAVNISLSFHVFVYSLSFFENNITRHVRWAAKHAEEGALFLLLENTKRIPTLQAFVEAMAGHGWKKAFHKAGAREKRENRAKMETLGSFSILVFEFEGSCPDTFPEVTFDKY